MDHSYPRMVTGVRHLSDCFNHLIRKTLMLKPYCSTETFGQYGIDMSTLESLHALRYPVIIDYPRIGRTHTGGRQILCLSGGSFKPPVCPP